MKILILSTWGGGTALGWRMVKEGHQVRMWIKPHTEGVQRDEGYEESTVGDGFIPKVKNYEGGGLNSPIHWADYIILDDGGLGKLGDKIRRENPLALVWGGSEWSDNLENDRKLGQELCKQGGMKIIPSKEFKSLPEAIAFVKSAPKRYVAKPSGEIQNEKALSYVGKDDSGSDMVSILEQYQAKWSSKIKSIEIQEFKKGIEVGISGFFDGSKFLDPIEISFEHKKLMNGDIGPSTGEMGTSMVWMDKSKKIYKESIGKVAPLLAQKGYKGYFDINCIAEGEILWPLEPTPRFGYPTIQLKMETISEDIGKLFYQILKGERLDFKISSPYSICVVLATPPYPFESKEIYQKYSEDQEIIFSIKDRRGFWPAEVLRNKANDWFITGESGFSVIVTGSGKNIKDARDMAYKRVEGITIPNMFYRTDIGEKTTESLKKLKFFGWFDSTSSF